MKYRTAAVAAPLILVAAALSAQPAPDANPVLLEVNGEPVYASDVSMVMQGLGRRAQQQGSQMDQSQLVEAATRQVVEQKLLAQEARRLELKVDEARVEQALGVVIQGSGGRESLEANLARAGTTIDHFEANLRERDLVKVYIDTQIRPGIEVTDEEIAAYYNANPDVFVEPDRVRARHILITVSQGADAEAVESARARAAAARKRAIAGEDFAALATELSEGPSAGNGGSLGVFSAEQMVKPFADAAFALEAGEISEVVQTRFGFHVIKVEERLPAGKTSLEDAHDRLQAAIASQKAARAVAAVIETLNGKAEIVPRLNVEQAPAADDAPQVGPAGPGG